MKKISLQKIDYYYMGVIIGITIKYLLDILSNFLLVVIIGLIITIGVYTNMSYVDKE